MRSAAKSCKRPTHNLLRHIASHGDPADALGKHPVDASAYGLFVVKEIRIHSVDCHAISTQRQPHRLDEALYAEAVFPAKQAHLLADVRRPRHADRHSLAVPIADIVRLLLDRMCNRMFEVQNAAQTALALVPANDISLDLTGTRDHMRCGRRRERKHVRTILLEPRKELAVADDAVLDDLAESRGYLTLRQSSEQVEIRKDRIGLVERPDEILAERMVDGNFAANARVDLCKNGTPRI